MSQGRIFISAGEASGDAYAAALIDAILQIEPTKEFEGVGGKRMSQKLKKLVADSSNWGAISVIESLKVAPVVIAGFLKAKKQLASGSPGLFIAIDYGFLNVRLLKFAKRKRWKTVYFIPPSSWKKGRAGKEVATFSDAVIVPFEFNTQPYQELGCNVRYFGHPLLELRFSSHSENRDRENFIAVMPGSRAHELNELLPLIAKIIPEDVPAHFLLAPTSDLEAMQNQWRSLAANRTSDRFTSGNTFEVLSRASVGIICSGTATLEAAILRCPMIVVYKFPKSAEFEAKILEKLGLFSRPKFISLPNILLEQEIVPEFVQENATVEKCTTALQKLRTDPRASASQIEGFDRLAKLLGEPHAITESAQFIVSLCN